MAKNWLIRVDLQCAKKPISCETFCIFLREKPLSTHYIKNVVELHSNNHLPEQQDTLRHGLGWVIFLVSHLEVMIPFCSKRHNNNNTIDHKQVNKCTRQPSVKRNTMPCECHKKKKKKKKCFADLSRAV
mgnify:CR=1 FL=1